MSEDKNILARARRGELPAFEELVTLYEKRVFAVALRSSGSPEDAADITQETFLRAWRGMDSFRGDSGFSTWLFRSAMNLCVDARATAGQQRAGAGAFRGPERSVRGTPADRFAARCFRPELYRDRRNAGNFGGHGEIASVAGAACSARYAAAPGEHSAARSV